MCITLLVKVRLSATVDFMNHEITSADIEAYKSTILEQQRVLQEMLVDPEVGIGHIYELITQTVAQLDGATEDWLREDICLSGSGYAPETDDEGNITRIVKISKAVCTASFNGAYGIILDTKSNSILYSLEEAETKARDDLVLQFGYHAVLEPQSATTQAGNLFYYEQRVRQWYAFFPVEESSISFLRNFVVFHEICFPDPDSNDFTKVRIDTGVHEAKNKQNIRHLLDVLNNGIKNKNPLEKELYLAYANKLLEKEGVLIEEAYAHKTYFAHVDGGYEEVVNENTVSQIKTVNGAPLRFILLGTEEDSNDDREIAITVATDEYEALLPLGSIMNCKIKLKQ